MIIVTGASGQLGRAIVERLVARMPSTEVAASVRDPAKVGDLAALGVRVRQGDFAQPDTLASAFEGATQVLLVSSNARATGGDTLAQHRAAIAAARDAGVRRVVYTSQAAARPASLFPPMWDHAATEDMLRESGLAWTALRNGFYASSGLQFMGQSSSTGLLEAPEDGPVAWTAHGDLAEAAAMILADEGRFEGPTPPLTGPEALDLAALAELAMQVTGRPIERRVIADDVLRSRLPSPVAATVLGFYAAARAGEWALPDPTLAHLLGRTPTTMKAVMGEQPSMSGVLIS